MKVAVGMTHMINNGGQDAKELKDLVNAKMEEAMKLFELIKGRHMVHMLLAHFKTFDNSEMFYGFDHLSSLVCGPDLHVFVKGWKNILDNMNGVIAEANLRDVFYRKPKSYPDLKLDMNTYECNREENHNKTYKWLMDTGRNV